MEIKILIIIGTLFTLLTTLLLVFFIFRYHTKNVELNLLKQNKQLIERDEASKKVILAVENERNRISRELHDQNGSDLLLLKLGIADIKKEIEQNSEIRLHEKFETLNDSINRVIFASQDLSRQLYPQTLNKYGCIYSIENLLQSHNEVQSEITFELSSNLNEEPDMACSLSIYRIIQELLNNAIKHSKASRAIFKITEDINSILLNYSDNGIGIGMQENLTKGSGIIGIENRVKAQSGEIKIKNELNGLFIQITLIK